MFQTERLLIRNFKIEDAGLCFEGWGKDKELGKFILGYPMTDISQMKAFVTTLIRNEDAWIIMGKEKQNCIG